MIVNKWFILNAGSQTMYSDTGWKTLEEATDVCRGLNSVVEPRFANYMVVELSDAYSREAQEARKS